MGKMRVLVGCECSGAVRRQFRMRGHDAWSNDIKEAEDGSSHHLQMDVFEAIRNHGPWDMAIFHPDCTYLTIAAEWCYTDEAAIKAEARGSTKLFGAARREAREEALAFFRSLWDCEIENVCMENPRGVVATRLGLEATQSVQPYEYGHDASKRTCLWLRGPRMKKLRPTRMIAPKHGCPTCRIKFPLALGKYGCPSCHGKPKHAGLVWGNQTPAGQNALAPGENRWVERSRTYTGIARAMAVNWSPDLVEPEDIL